MLGFLFGAVAGALAATYWRADIKRLREQRMPGLREKAADRVEDMERAIVGTVGRLSTRARSKLRSRSGSTQGTDGGYAPGESTPLG